MSSTLPAVCVLAGGRGTRLAAHTSELPKPLVEVAGAPFLHHQLRLLRTHGANRVVLCVGYLGDLIERSVGDGSRFGLEVRYSYDGPDLIGTAGAVRRAMDQLGDEFLVLYGDTYLRIDYAAVVEAFRASGCPALMTVLHNGGRWDTSNATFDGRLVSYDKRKPRQGMDWIDYGLGVLTPAALAAAPESSDLADVYAALSRIGLLAGYPATERFYEIGTPAALAATGGFLAAVSGAAGGEG